MKSIVLSSTYDPEADAGYIYFDRIHPGEVVANIMVEDERLGGYVVLDLDRKNRLLGIELIGVRRSLVARPQIGHEPNRKF